MIKLDKFALLGAFALTGVFGFTACSSDDELGGPDVPGIDGDVVKTQFAINIPHAQGTRMSADVTQYDKNFRGMSNIRLVPFKLTTTPTEAGTPVNGTEMLLYNAIVLGNIATTDKDWNESSNSKVYNDIDIPLGTNAFLFYGEATEENASDPLDKEQINGVLNPSYETTGLTVGKAVSTINFNLQPILGAVTGVNDAQNALLNLLNAVAGVEGEDNTKWSAVKEGDNKALYDYYQELIKLTAGSANSIRLALQDLYNSMNSDRVEDYKGLKAAIKSAILGASNTNFKTPTGTEPNQTLEYADAFAGKTYPAEFNLPDGAVSVKWDDTDKFEYVTTNPGNTGLNVAAIANYVYPASLYYWTNTSIKTATSPQEGSYGTNNWETILNTLYTGGRAVEANTQSVAMEQTINYGVGRFDLNAAFAQGEIKDGDNEVVTLPQNGFQLTGVLIGGQKNVGWNFAPAGDTEYTIYDAAVDADTYVNRTAGLKNRTLVLETAGTTGTPYEEVQFALEFVNNSSEAFQGKDGIVPVGGKFYLVGKITANDDNKKVFQQDYYTTANATINTLKNAYNVIPDLRTPQLELGLSVDLKWEKGLDANVVVGGE